MVTRLISLPHKSPSVALSDPYWRDTMYDEYNALIKNGTWILVPKPTNVNAVRSMWLFQHKYHADGSLSRYKARLVANISNQQYGVDCNDTFSLVVKPASIRTLLSLALARNWPVHQLDVENAFLNDDLTETVYMYQPSVFVDSRFPHHKYAIELLERAHMSNCNATRTPADTESKFDSGGDPVSYSTLYCSLAGGLQYLTFTWPDICYVVQQICLHMHDPREPHLAALKRVLCYICGTLDHGLQLHVTLSRSSAQAEYRGVVNVVAETTWIPQGQVRVLYVPSRYQYADFTKGLPTALFEEFHISLSVRSSPAQTADES
nr:ribonuclease H-like domain-containing protein [Tanacetum cinerariifolium]